MFNIGDKVKATKRYVRGTGKVGTVIGFRGSRVRVSFGSTTAYDSFLKPEHIKKVR